MTDYAENVIIESESEHRNGYSEYSEYWGFGKTIKYPGYYRHTHTILLQHSIADIEGNELRDVIKDVCSRSDITLYSDDFDFECDGEYCVIVYDEQGEDD